MHMLATVTAVGDFEGEGGGRGTLTTEVFPGTRKIERKDRLRAVLIFPLEFVEPRKDIATRSPRAGVCDVFPRLDELKRKNRDCS